RAARASPIRPAIRSRLPSRSPTTLFIWASASLIGVFARQSRTYAPASRSSFSFCWSFGTCLRAWLFAIGHEQARKAAPLEVELERDPRAPLADRLDSDG